MKLYLEGSQTVVQDTKELKLEYYLVEVNRSEWEDSAYGIKIIQHEDFDTKSEYSEPISYCKDIVEKMVKILWVNTVTATSMLEIVDDLVSQ